MNDELRRIVDPFLGKEVEISNRLTDHLRGRYASGPAMLNGEPEFGWRKFETPPIQHEAATEIERFRALLDEMREMLIEVRDKGLIYWEPQTARGIVSRSLMFDNIERVLRGDKRRKA